MEKVPKRAARFACNEYSRSASVTNMMKRLGWGSLEGRRCQARHLIIYKETQGLIPSNIKHLQSNNSSMTKPTTRQSSKKFVYDHIRANKRCYQESLYPRTTPTWNQVPDNNYERSPNNPKIQGSNWKHEVWSIIWYASEVMYCCLNVRGSHIRRSYISFIKIKIKIKRYWSITFQLKPWNELCCLLEWWSAGWCKWAY